MSAHATVRWKLDAKEVRELRHDEHVREFIRQAGEQFEEELRAAVPVDTGAGAASIGLREMERSGSVRVGWDAAHWYLHFPEFGTKYQAAQRFTRALVDEYEYQ